VRPRDLHVVAEDARVADLERGNACALALGGFHAGDEVTSVAGDGAEVVQLLGETGADGAALAERGGRVVGDGALQEVYDAAMGVDTVEGPGQGVIEGGGFRELGAEVGEGVEAATEVDEVAREGDAGAGAVDEPLQVGNAVEEAADAGATDAGGEEPFDGVLSGADLVEVEEGLAEPLAEEAGAHGGLREVEEGEERALASTGEPFEELEGADGLGVQSHGAVQGLGGEGLDLGEGALLGVLEVGKDGPGGGDGQGKALAAVGIEGGRAEVREEALAGVGGVEEVGIERGEDGVGSAFQGQAAGDEDLGGAEALELGGEVLSGELEGDELRGGDVHVGEAGAVRLQDGGGEEVVGAAGEEVRLQDGAGGDDADDVPLQDALGGAGVAELLADGDAVALGQEAGEVGLQGDGGDAGEGDAVALAELFGGEGDVQVSGEDEGVVAEGLIEVAEAKEEEAVGELGLEALVLLPKRAAAVGGRRGRLRRRSSGARGARVGAFGWAGHGGFIVAAGVRAAG
jgi:hypothetical protein